MNEDRWQRMEELFHAALDKPESERRSFLEQSCSGDLTLFADVESLVSKASGPDSGPISDPTPISGSGIASRVRSAAVLVAHPPRTGRRIGQYRVVEEIGHGGMGLVYRATRDDQEFQMQVAIKVAREGFESSRVLERFRRERQILARLDHPYIAKLFDGGTTEDGLPYFVMEYVEGLPIHKYAKAKELGIRARLELFRKICEAVAHAHQNLVVHLDLKPSNILVARDGTPKLLDFGISRLLETAEPEHGVTQTFGGVRLLTPDYASPEQIRGQPVNTSTDVYSLGVVLYQLLTGELPHRLDGLSPQQVESTICDTDAERPSVRAPQLRRQLSGDIDNIVLTAMAKESSRRYRSVLELDEDIRRHLSSQAVHARAGSGFYRFRKFLWRNRLLVGATAAVIVALSAGLVTTRMEARRADEQRQVADIERQRAERNSLQAARNASIAFDNSKRADAEANRADLAFKKADAARIEADAQRKLADGRFNDVRGLASAYLFDFNDALAATPGTLQVRRHMVDLGLGFLDRLASQKGLGPQMTGDLASGYLRMGDVLGNPDVPNLGDTKAALESYGKADKLLASLSTLQNDELLIVESGLHARISTILLNTGPADKAVEEGATAAKYAREASSKHPNDKKYDRNLAETLSQYDQTLTVSGTARAVFASVQETRPVLLQLAARYPDDPDFQMWLALDYSAEGRALRSSGDLTGAIDRYRKDVEILEGVTQRWPGDVNRKRQLMFAYSHLGDTLGNPQQPNIGDLAGAVAVYQKMSAIADSIAAADPQNVTAPFDAAMSAGRLGGLQLLQGDPQGAIVSLQRCVAGLERMVAVDPRNRRNINLLALNVQLLGDAQQDAGNFSESAMFYEKAANLVTGWINSDPTNTSPSISYVESQLRWGLLLSRQHDPKALEHAQASMNELERVRHSKPELVNNGRLLLRMARGLGARALIHCRLADSSDVPASSKGDHLRACGEDLASADQYISQVPQEIRKSLPAADFQPLNEARRLLTNRP